MATHETTPNQTTPHRHRGLPQMAGRSLQPEQGPNVTRRYQQSKGGYAEGAAMTFVLFGIMVVLMCIADELSDIKKALKEKGRK